MSKLDELVQSFEGQKTPDDGIDEGGYGLGVLRNNKDRFEIPYLKIYQPTTGVAPEEGKIGEIFYKGANATKKSFEGVILLIGNRKSYSLDREYLCGSPTGDVGRARKEIHKDHPLNNCLTCKFREKPAAAEGAYTKAPCTASYRLIVWIPENGFIGQVDLKGTSFKVGDAIVQQRRPLATSLWTFSTEKFPGKPFYKWSASYKGENTEEIELVREAQKGLTAEMRETFNEMRAQLKEQQAAVTKTEASLSTDDNIPF
jgi:hypothetical protein